MTPTLEFWVPCSALYIWIPVTYVPNVIIAQPRPLKGLMAPRVVLASTRPGCEFCFSPYLSLASPLHTTPGVLDPLTLLPSLIQFWAFLVKMTLRKLRICRLGVAGPIFPPTFP